MSHIDQEMLSITVCHIQSLLDSCFRICILPTADEVKDKRYLAYINQDKVGLHILPLDGNPHNSMALVAHPGGVSNMVPSYDGKYLFTAGGGDTSVHMWHINLK